MALHSLNVTVKSMGCLLLLSFYLKKYIKFGLKSFKKHLVMVANDLITEKER